MTYWHHCVLCRGTGRYQYTHCRLCGGRGGWWEKTQRDRVVKRAVSSKQHGGKDNGSVI